MPDFQSFPLTLNAVIFVVTAVVIWFVGTRASLYADALSSRTGLGKAFAGLLLLALASSLPEVGLAVTASLNDTPELAINAVFGGIVFQTVILAIVDFFFGRGALTFFTPKPVLLLQGIMLILLIAVAVAGIMASEVVALFGVGLWSCLLGYLYIVSLLMAHRYEGSERWQAQESQLERETREDAEQGVLTIQQTEQHRQREEKPLNQLVLLFVGASLVILVAGVLLAQIGEALAGQTGLGTSFIGATLIAIATSLPELSMTIGAARLGNFSMAVANIFGSNSLMVFVLFIADIAYRRGPILNEVDAPAVFSAAMGIAVTAIYLAGLVERRDRTVLRMGIDSVVVIGLYAVTLAVLYALR